MMNRTNFFTSVEALFIAIPELKAKILSNVDSFELKEKCRQKEKGIILQNLSICILDPEFTESIGYHLQSWLLEIIGWCNSVIGSFNKEDFDSLAHSALCVCLSKLLNDDVVRFALSYFQEAPSPFHYLMQETKAPVPKKRKLNYEIPSVTEMEILEASYNLLSNIGPDISTSWDFSDLFKYLQHEDEKMRWFACNCIALLVRMSEDEKKKFILRNVSIECHTQMIVSTNSKPSYSKYSSTSSGGDCLTSAYTQKIGCIMLPLYSKKENKKKDTLVPLSSTQHNLEAIALGISSSRPVLIEGVVGSGKTSLVEYLGEITGRNKAPELSKIQLSDQTDSKTLIGTYRCTANPGEFIWQAGSLTQAVTKGYWLLLEDIDFAPVDVISLLIPLLESRVLPVPGHGNIKAHPSFHLFATRRILPAGCRIRIGSANLIEKLWAKVSLQSLTSSELKELICTKWPQLESISGKLVEVYLVLSYGQHGDSKPIEGCQQCLSLHLTSTKTSGRFVSVRDLMKWCSRMVSHIDEKDLNLRAFQEAVDCFCSAVPDPETRISFALHIGSHLNVSEPAVRFFLCNRRPEVSVKPSVFTVGPRGQLARQKNHHISILSMPKSTFSKTRLSSCLLEKVTVAVMNKEPVLVVGETGTGKTSTIQYLAQQTNHPLRVINMNQQSDSTDLLGGFKPVEVRTVVSPLRSEFEDLFVNTFSAKQNTKFLSHIMMTFTRRRWDDLFSLMRHSTEKAQEKLRMEKKTVLKIKNLNGPIEALTQNGKRTMRTTKEIKTLMGQWQDFQLKLKTVLDQVERVKSSLAFAFIEGTLVKAIEQGDWVLLDEINLASADTLECLTGLLESSSGSVTLHERGDSKPIARHADFCLFACMNPATDVGKKELPVGLRNRFTEFFMEEFKDEDDLKQIVNEYLQELNPSSKQIKGIVDFYSEIRKCSVKELTDGTGHKPHFSLRTLCRSLIVARKNPCKHLPRSLYEAFCLSFLTQLDRSSYPKVTNLIEKFILGKTKGLASKQRKDIFNTSISCPGDPTGYVQVEGFWVPKGDREPQAPEKYILTKTVRDNLRDLVRIVSIGRFPVLLQGDTSVGKTSLISYVAKLTGNNCVRINNHQHTDLQEYVGSYAPDETGKLVFKEGVLVKAMRNGHWIILDELNLAPTDVLEALNRLLDDNRELFIPEIETTVKAHPRFMLFATQNPPGLYGGRQVLSRAFRNRFVELHFNLIPSEELQTILHGRCEIAPSLSKKMVEVLKDLQNRRRASNIFEGKQSFITLRDLFRWAERYRLAPKVDKFYDWDQHMADEGYLVLAGKIRLKKEMEAIKDVLKKHLKREVKSENLFNLSSETSPVTKYLLEKLGTIKSFEHVVWTQDMRRLFVLVSKALSFCEPVLLVGETGCGKTTVCQMIAAMNRQALFTINCHMHTEGADFLGGLRPVRNRSTDDDDRLFEWVDGPLIQSMKGGGIFLADEISLADDSVLERLNSVLEPERTLVLSEKGSDDGEGIESLETIVAHEHFRLIGTMNPGGDYGKKELSPALRNRLTEIWCPKVEVERPSSDVKLIIEHNIDISVNENLNIGNFMLSFLKYFTETDLGKKMTVSIRDILSWVTFINKVTTETVFHVDVGSSYVHGACLVFLDSLGSGTTGSTILNWRRIKQASLMMLCLQAQKMTKKLFDPSAFCDVKSVVFRNDSETFGIEPFLIPKGNFKQIKPIFSFEAPRTCLNLLRLLRGLQLSRPILLEGSPGVGKTSLVVALAKASDNDIVRINLSEQTDVSDLFGADLPVEGSEGGRFAWRDGPLLQALKKGSWVVLDELNLASQSVLEGLNACFDHRGEIYVPELNKTFTVKHRVTKIFACQNPQYEGGARKGLPKSFLNRFTQVFVEPLTSDDLEFILGMAHAQIPSDLVTKMVRFNEILVKEIQEQKLWGSKGGPWELNLRDMFRWCEVMLENQSETELNPGEFVEMIYADRMRTKTDRVEVLRVYENVFPTEQFPLYKKMGTFYIHEKTVQVGRAFLRRTISGNEFKEQSNSELFILQNQTPYLESLINCINMKWMTLLVGGSEEGKTSLVYLLAELAGERLETLAVNSHMDVTELLGGFEQADYGRRLSEFIEELQEVVWSEVRTSLLNSDDVKDASDYLGLWKQLSQIRETKTKRTTSEEVAHFVQICEAIRCLIDFLKKKQLDDAILRKLKRIRKACLNLGERVTTSDTISGGGTFEWVDSPLVKAVRNGHWLLIDGVNLCSPSVLDRLNSLLEPGGVLTMSERGVIKGSVPTVSPHPNFRLFLIMDSQYGEISRAMRNRGVEICVQGMWQNDMDIKALLLSQGLEDINTQNLLIKTHFNICKALPGYERPSISCLRRAASLTTKLLQLGQSFPEAVNRSLLLVYVRNFGKRDVKRIIENMIESSLKYFKQTLKSSKGKTLPPVNKLLLSTQTLAQSSSLGFLTQLVALIGTIQTNKNLNSKKMMTTLSFPEPVPTSRDGLATAVFLSLISIPLRHWKFFKALLNQFCSNNIKLLDAVGVIISDPSISLQLLENISDGDLPADPRFNTVALNSKVDSNDLTTISSLSNKALIGLWVKVEATFTRKEGKTNRRKSKSDKKEQCIQSILELSQSISKGLVGEKMVYHPSLRHIAPLLEAISALLLSLSNNLEVNLTDEEYFKLREASVWRKRLETLCEKVVSKDSFHLFLPQLVFHWKQLQDKLLDNIPSTWQSLLPEEMPQLKQELKQSFRSHCSPLHNVIPELRNHIGNPLSFSTETSAAVFMKVSEVAETLIPYLGIDNKKEIEKALFVASESGLEVKSGLVNLAFDMIEETSDMTEIMTRISSLEAALSNNLSRTDLKDSRSSPIHLWPVMDYLISRQLSLTEARNSKEVKLNECREVLVKSSSIPLQCICDPDSSKGVAAVALYLFNISNCSVFQPSSWLNFDPSETEETKGSLRQLCWEGENSFILSPMGCLLTYQLLVEFCKPDQEIGDISVGNHAERITHLNQIRMTLLQNWKLLSEPAYLYGSCYKEIVKGFFSELITSLMRTLNVNIPLCSSNDLVQIIDCSKTIIREHEELLGSESTSLLREIQKLGFSVEASGEDIVEIAKLGILAGLLQSWLLSHIEPLDPAQQRNLLLSYYKQELSEIKDFLLLHRWLKVLRYSQTTDELHPHHPHYKNTVNKLESNVQSLSQKVAHRPQPSQYAEIAQDISHFINTVFLPSRITELMRMLTNKPNNVRALLQQCEGTLRSCDNFIRKLVKTYPLYRDLVTPLLHGVVIVCESVRLLMVVTRNKELSLSIQSSTISEQSTNIDETVSRMLYFPSLRNLKKPENFLTQTMNDQKRITDLIRDHASHSSYGILSQSLSLRASFYDLYNNVVATNFFTNGSFTFLKGLIERVILWWQEQENERKRKKEEEESLFRYKTRSLAISETEEEEIEREYEELFPDFYDEFMGLENSMEEDEEMEEAGKSSEKEENDVLKLSDEHLEEVVEVHKLLMFGFTETPWITPEKNCQKKTVTPITLRTHQVQLLMRSVGPYGTHEVDEAALGALILSNHVACSSKRSLQLSAVNKPFNYYQDSDLEEALKVRPLLEALESRANELLEKWPAHPSLLMIKKVINRVLGFSVSSPLIRLVIGLEMVLEKSQEWEKNAHRGVSLMAELTPITEQIVAWRKMELKAWGSCLDMITYKVSVEANKYWPHLYESLLSVTTENVNDVIQPLKQFMESSSVGSYKRRLEILRAVHCHLSLELKYCSEDCNKEALETLAAVTWNFYKYYSQFLPHVEDMLQKNRKPIEKKVKDYIKITKWNDINFFAVRDSVIKSRRTLHRHMRNWEKVLRQPFSPLLMDSISDISGGKGEWDKEKTPVLPLKVFESLDVETGSVIGAEEKSHVGRLPSLTKRSSELIYKIHEKMTYTENIEAVGEMTGEIITTYQDLTVATAKAENMDVKEERLRQLKDIMNRKKKSLAILFKSLHHLGVSHTRGNSLWQDDDLDKCLIVPPLDVKVALKEMKDCGELKSCWESCDKYFYKSIGRHALLVKSLHQAHGDLGPEDIKRLKGSVSHLLLLSRQLRQVVPEFSVATSEIDLMVNEIDKASQSFVPETKEFANWWDKVYCFIVSLTLTLEEEIKLLETFPNCDSLLDLHPLSQSLTQLKVKCVIADLEKIHSDLADVIKSSHKINKALSDEAFINLASGVNIKELEDVVSNVRDLAEKVSSSIRELDQDFKATTSLTKPLITWIDEWKELKTEFDEWKSHLIHIDIKFYSSSDKVDCCLGKILKAIERLYKYYEQESNKKTEDVDSDEATKFMISEGIIRSLLSDYERLHVVDVKKAVFALISDLKENTNPTILVALRAMKPLLLQYLTVCKNLLTSMIAGFRGLSKLQSVLLAIFQQLATKGFCRPQELEKQDGEGATQFEDSGPGLSEGEGKKDVSERFESEDQLESALQEGEKEEEGNKNLNEENGIEMSQDFEGNLQDMQRDEEKGKGDDSENEDEEEEHDKQMGETEKGADKLDEKLWGDEEDDKNEEDGGGQKEEEEEHGPGDGETTQSELVAKDDNKSKEENEKEERKKKELEVMEEDRREPNEEEEEETYDDNYRDKFGGEGHPDHEEEEEMELPEDLNLDGKEKDDNDDEEEDPEMNPEIEEKGLFPEEEREPKEKKDEQTEDEGEEEAKNNNKEGEGEGEEEEEKGEKSEQNKQRIGEEEGDKDDENKKEGVEDDEDKALPSKDKEAIEEAQAADMETMEASKDKTQDDPETATGAQLDQDEEQKQEEQGQVGEQTEDVTGVGQSDSKTKEESHKGETSVLTSEEEAKQKMEEQNKPRKPGDIDQIKSLGEVEKEIHQGLMTKKASASKEEKEEKNDNEEAEEEKTDKEPEDKDASLYEHIGKAEDHFDKQTVDAGTQEEATLRPAPLEEEEEGKEEQEGIEDTLMEGDEVEEAESKEETRKREAETEGNEGPDVKKLKGETDPRRDQEIKDHQMQTEGDVVVEMTVQRPIANEFHTRMDEEEVVAATFNEDLAVTREKIDEVGEGDARTGSEQWLELEGRISPLALQLCEQLRLILEPTEAAKLKGDFRTGKRLNMRKVIPYIASQFRKDKIWLRRTQPNKRSYQVLLAVDDSESMNEVKAGNLARESVALVAKALTLLEVGQVGIVSFGAQTRILHPFHKPFSDQNGAKIFANIKFDQTKSNFAQMLEDSVALLAGARGGQSVQSDIAQLLLILSDGQTHARSKAVKAAVRAARESRVFIVFLVLDAQDNKYSFYDACVYEDGEIKSMVDTFPFPFFLVVRDLEGLPDAIAEALRQWFELVTADAY